MEEKTNHDKETCVVCHKALDIDKTMPVDERKYYVKGAGQLCKECYEELYGIWSEE